ncbi:hypothetical protein FBR02_15335 [Anaerolineae bacterium CFX9]|nr:hypothetical protein [Anaerolineae bacterium CFX9]
MMKKYALLLVIMCGLLALPASAQETAVFSETLEQQMDELVAITERLRGLETITPVERAFPTRSETIAYLTALYERDLPREEADRALALYVALDLLSPDIDFTGIFLELLGSQVAGFYDPETQTMNVIPLIGDSPGARLSLLEQIIFVHEYTHALQDQHFGLNTYLEAAQDAPDEALARLALVEGDATAVMQLYTNQVAARNPLAALSLLTESLRAGNLTLPPGVPSALVDELLFPYNQGLSFVLALYGAGGWDAIHAAYDNPPTTTEQVLHPDKYLAGEGALPVTLPDYAPLLGDSWVQAWDITLGEYYLNAFLRTQLSPAEAGRASSGWGGDRFAVWTNDAGEFVSVLRFRADTLADQAEFGEAISAWAEAKFDAGAEDGCWASAAEAFCVRSGESLGALIVRAPAAALARALLEVETGG